MHTADNACIKVLVGLGIVLARFARKLHMLLLHSRLQLMQFSRCCLFIQDLLVHRTAGSFSCRHAQAVKLKANPTLTTACVHVVANNGRSLADHDCIQRCSPN